MNQILLVVVALLAGFVGGVFGTQWARVYESPRAERVVRARSFELVDQTGRVISFWGIDKRKRAVVAFASQGPALRAGEGGRSSPELDDPLNQTAAMGVIDTSPFLDFRVADGSTRMRLYLNGYDKPMMLMEDETGVRMSLGVEQSDTPGPGDNDWALDFGPENWARIGMFSREAGGQRYVQGLLSVKREKSKYPYHQRK